MALHRRHRRLLDPEFASGNFLILCFAIWLPIFPAMITASPRTAGRCSRALLLPCSPW
jgi:hypothetical protein